MVVPNVVSAVDGKAYSSTAATIAEFLRDAPRGVYTTARTIGYNSILDFEFHVRRLYESIQGYLAERHQSVEAFPSEQRLREVLVHQLRSIENDINPYLREREKRLTILICAPGNENKWDNDRPFGLIHTHLTELPMITASGVKVQLMEGATGHGSVKDSAWVEERAKLQIPPEFNEIIFEEGGHISQGMSSNVWLLHASTGVWHTQTENVIKGTVQNEILHMMPQTTSTTPLTQRDLLDPTVVKEVAISSTTRGFLPVLSITDAASGKIVRHWDETPVGSELRRIHKAQLAENGTLIWTMSE